MPPVTAVPAPRRSIAVISHPDAGKSTITEALALLANAIGQAGAVHGKAGRAGVVSDWQEMEKTRGISISSAALQFDYKGTVINLLDTPGHADFSEDTYRVLTAVDVAVMLLDSAKGLEPQTLKLFEVCRRRGIPIITDEAADALAFDAVIISNSSPVHARQRASQWRARCRKPVFELFDATAEISGSYHPAASEFHQTAARSA